MEQTCVFQKWLPIPGPTNRVLKVEHGIHSCPNFSAVLIFPDQPCYIVKKNYIYMKAAAETVSIETKSRYKLPKNALNYSVPFIRVILLQ
jgi:hypothetical protein